MTLQELIDYYTGLLIIQYNDMPKAIATMDLLAEQSVLEQLPEQVRDSFDLDSAIGVQLDILAKYVGVVRSGRTFESYITLDDDDFRSLITIGIAKNYSQSSLYDIQELINTYFPQTLLVFDYQNMSMSYLFDSAIGSEQLAEMFVVNGLLPKPQGVQLSSLIYGSNINAFFGYRTYDFQPANNTGYNSYTDYQTDWPWLSYDNAIIV